MHGDCHLAQKCMRWAFHGDSCRCYPKICRDGKVILTIYPPTRATGLEPNSANKSVDIPWIETTNTFQLLVNKLRTGDLRSVEENSERKSEGEKIFKERLHMQHGSIMSEITVSQKD